MRKTKSINIVVCLLAVLLLVNAVNALLIDNVIDTITQIKDDGSILKWLKDAASINVSWYSDMTWAESLIFVEYDDWHLPSTNNVFQFCSGEECANSDMTYLYYVEFDSSPFQSHLDVSPFVSMNFNGVDSNHWYRESGGAANPLKEENIAKKTEHASLITVDADAPKIVPKKDLTTYINIRQTPSQDSTLIGKLRPREQLDYVRSFNYWHEVKLDNGQTGYISKNWTRIVSDFPEKSTGKASVSSVKQSPPQIFSNESKEYYVQVGAWRNQNYAQKVLEKIKNYYPEAYIVVHNSFNKIRILGVLTKKQGVTVAKDIEEKFNMKSLLILKTH
jgi:hypothetical protein